MNKKKKYIIISICILLFSFLKTEVYPRQIDATSYTDWVYYSFTTHSEVIIDNPEVSLGWDIAFQRNHIKTNSGTSGIGMGGASVDSLELWTSTSFETISEIEQGTVFRSDTLLSVFYDLITHTFTDGSTNPNLETWGRIDTLNNYTMVVSNNQLVVRTADGNNFIKIWPYDYYNDVGSSGHISLIYSDDINCSYGIDDCGICGGNSNDCSTDLANEAINSFNLLNNYPNPFNPSTTIPFNVASISNIDISILDIKGKIINNLVSELHNPGNYEVIWDGRNNHGRKVGSGVYFYRLSSGEKEISKKLVIID